MLRMEFSERRNRIIVGMQGHFVGDFAEHARRLIVGSKTPSMFVVDLSGVIYVDAAGEEVLVWFKEIGVTFTADSPYSRDVCTGLRLPIACEQSYGPDLRDSGYMHSPETGSTTGILNADVTQL